MKIAILTQPLGKNYGGIMQAYALQRVLQNFGHDVVTIDRQPEKRRLIKRLLLPFKPIIYKLIGRDPVLEMTQNQSEDVYSEMDRFIAENINMSKPINCTKALKLHCKKEKYDLIIIGSDQVWRPKYSPNIYNFFADFVNIGDRCITYAASFGVDEWEFDKKQTASCKKLIKKFNAVSVREDSALELCKNKFNIDAFLVLDPTLLLDSKDYETLFSNLNSRGNGKVLKYILDDSNQKKNIIEEVIKNLNKPLFSAQPYQDLRNIKNISDFDKIDDYKYPAVEEWIMSFRDSDFVVTDSFHGCVFAIIFNKPFIAIGNHERGLSRFKSLLFLFGLSDRLIVDSEINIGFVINNKIDWMTVNKKIEEYRKKSFFYLNNAGDI